MSPLNKNPEFRIQKSEAKQNYLLDSVFWILYSELLNHFPKNRASRDLKCSGDQIPS
jgi:hypothetical protein